MKQITLIFEKYTSAIFSAINFNADVIFYQNVESFGKFEQF